MARDRQDPLDRLEDNLYSIHFSAPEPCSGLDSGAQFEAFASSLPRS